MARTGTDLLSDLESHVGDLGREGFTAAVAEIHNRSLEFHPQLAELLRGPLMLKRIADTAATRSVILAKPASELAIESQRAFELEVSVQLEQRKQMLPSSEILAIVVPAFEARADAARKRQEDHAAAEIARVLKERKEAEEIIRREERKRQAELDRIVHEAERAAARVLRAKLHEIGLQLARRIRKLKLEGLRLWGGSLYSAADLITSCETHGFSEERLASLDEALSELEKNKRW